MTETSAAADTPARSGVGRTAASGAVGNVLEWFDFAVYGYMAPFLSNLFFPSADPLSSLLAVYGAFAAGYVARPLGGMVFGHLGDTIGRKFVMMASVTMMGVSTVAIGLLPTFEQIGPLAAVLLVVLRVCQGISVGGEYTGSAVFVAERTPGHLRGLVTSFNVVGCIGGFVVGSALAATLTNLYSDAAMAAGVWRVPFLTGVVIMAAGIVLRRSLDDAGAVDRTEHKGQSPVRVALRDHWRDIVRIAAMALSANVGFYLMFVFAISFLTDRMHVSTARAMDINTFCLVVMLFVPVLSGFVSDRIGRKPVLLAGVAATILFAWPLWWMMHHHDVTTILLGQLGFALIFGWVFGTNPVAMAEALPRHVRVTVLSIGYNCALAVFGGTAPAVATWLIERTADDFSPVYYLIGMSFVTLVAVVTLPETRGRRLHG
ncbi:MAG: MFS transporter [Pseudomonadota bacterium]